MAGGQSLFDRGAVRGSYVHRTRIVPSCWPRATTASAGATISASVPVDRRLDLSPRPCRSRLRPPAHLLDRIAGLLEPLDYPGLGHGQIHVGHHQRTTPAVRPSPPGLRPPLVRNASRWRRLRRDCRGFRADTSAAGNLGLARHHGFGRRNDPLDRHDHGVFVAGTERMADRIGVQPADRRVQTRRRHAPSPRPRSRRPCRTSKTPSSTTSRCPVLLTLAHDRLDVQGHDRAQVDDLARDALLRRAARRLPGSGAAASRTRRSSDPFPARTTLATPNGTNIRRRAPGPC